MNVKGGVFSGQYIAEFMTTDFAIFKKELKKLYNDLTGSAKFDPLEGQLVLNIKGNGLGNFELNCEASPVPEYGLSFSLSFDQTQIKDYVNQLDKITQHFPIDGDFNFKND